MTAIQWINLLLAVSAVVAVAAVCRFGHILGRQRDFDRVVEVEWTDDQIAA